MWVAWGLASAAGAGADQYPVMCTEYGMYEGIELTAIILVCGVDAPRMDCSCDRR